MSDFDEGGTQELQQFVLLAQSARGAACAALIRQVLAHPKVFVFGELLALPSVQDLQAGEHASALALLNTFAYGTWSDLSPAAAAALEPAMALKLKKLTVVSMCASADVLAYDVLQRAVDISSVRELEDMLISLIYDGLLRGKLDQRSKHIEVAHAIGRDVHPDDVAKMAAKLQHWHETTAQLMSCLSDQVGAYKQTQAHAAERKADLQARVQQATEKLKQGHPHMGIEGGSSGHEQYGGGHDHDVMMHEEGRHPRLGARAPKSKLGASGGLARRAQADFR